MEKKLKYKKNQHKKMLSYVGTISGSLYQNWSLISTPESGSGFSIGPQPCLQGYGTLKSCNYKLSFFYF
jgi:hypothetical protein